MLLHLSGGGDGVCKDICTKRFLHQNWLNRAPSVHHMTTRLKPWSQKCDLYFLYKYISRKYIFLLWTSIWILSLHSSVQRVFSNSSQNNAHIFAQCSWFFSNSFFVPKIVLTGNFRDQWDHVICIVCIIIICMIIIIIICIVCIIIIGIIILCQETLWTSETRPGR